MGTNYQQSVTLCHIIAMEDKKYTLDPTVSDSFTITKDLKYPN